MGGSFKATTEQLHNANEYVLKAKGRGGQVWACRLTVKDANGKRHALTKSFDPDTVKTKAQAKRAAGAWRRDLIADADARQGTPDSMLGITEYARKVIEESDAAETSKLGYSTYLNRIEAHFGSMPLSDLTAELVGEWQASLEAEGLAPTTIRHAHALLSQVMGRALEDGYVARNVCKMRAAKAPKKPYQEPNMLTADSREALLGYLADSPPSVIVTGAALAMYTGLRRGELCGLRWEDCDIEGKTIHVRKSIGKKRGGTYEKEPKTGASRRTVEIPEQAAEALRRRYKAMREEAASLGSFAEEDMLKLFVLGRVDGRYYNPDMLGHKWESLRDFLELKGTQKPPTLHDLRHTYISWLLQKGADVKTVASLAGHSDVAHTLNLYAAADPKAKRAAASLFESAAENGEKGKDHA